MRRAKRLFTLLITAFILAGAIPCAAAGETPYYEWKQYDSRWASSVLTTKTMKQVGCLATSIAMLAVQAGLRDEASFDPGVFAADMKKAGGFNGDDDLVWEAIPTAVPGLMAETPWARLDGAEAEKTALLKGYLDAGYQVAVAVRNGGHWVALRAITGGRAVMMDPACAATDLFTKYPAAGVTRAALLRADGPEPSPAKPSTPTQKEDYRIVAESIFEFLKDMGSLFLSIFQWFYTMGK